MVLRMDAAFEGEGTLYHDDPALMDSTSVATRSATMGDIVNLPGGGMELSVSVDTNSPIIRVDIFNGLDLIETVRPYGEEDLGARLRLHWEGAEYRGRFREVIWDGTATLDGNSLEKAVPVNFFNRDKTLDQNSETELSWKALTTGNFGGADLYLKDAASGTLSVKTPLISCALDIAKIGLEDTVLDASGELPRFLKLYRLPDVNPHTSFSFTPRHAGAAGPENPGTV